MWAQLVTARVRPGKEEGLHTLISKLQAAEQPGSGLVRSTAMRDQNDPDRVYMFAVFESEAAARRREQDPARQEHLREARALMAEVFDGPLEFVDLSVVGDVVY